MRRFGFYSIPAAIAMSGVDLANLAKRARVSEENLKAEMDGSGELTPAERRRVKADLWRRGSIVTVDTPVVEVAIWLGFIDTIRLAARYAERWPDSYNDGWRMWLFARAWRGWLRLRGKGDRIGRAVRVSRGE